MCIRDSVCPLDYLSVDTIRRCLQDCQLGAYAEQQWICLLYTSKGHTAVGIELSPDYHRIASDRLGLVLTA